MSETGDRRWLVELKIERGGAGWSVQGGLFDARGGWRKYGFGQDFGLGRRGRQGWSSPVEALTSAALSAVHMLGEVAQTSGRAGPGPTNPAERDPALPLPEEAPEMESDAQWTWLKTNWPRIEELHELLQRWEDEDAGLPPGQRSSVFTEP